MKVQSKSMTVLAVALSALFLSATVSAGCYHYKSSKYYKVRPFVLSSPVASCETGGTHISLPAYSCCQLLTVNKHNRLVRVWGNEWVSGSCSNADPRAVRAFRCGTNSPIHGTGMPIVAQCQFSYSTRVN